MTFLGGPQTDYVYTDARIVKVQDGDTVGGSVTLVDADVGFGIHVHQERFESRWRLAGINAPELSTPEGVAAKAHILELLGLKPPYAIPAEGIECTFTTSKDKADNYGRYLCTITMPDGTNINERMVADGFAEVWPKPKAAQ